MSRIVRKKVVQIQKSNDITGERNREKYIVETSKVMVIRDLYMNQMSEEQMELLTPALLGNYTYTIITK